MTEEARAVNAAGRRDDDAPLTFNFTIPAGWPSELQLAFAELMQKALDDGFPIVVPIRDDATPEQITQITDDIRALIKNAGLAVT
jgi:hypothetical protein